MHLATVERIAENEWVARVGALPVGTARAGPGSEPGARFVRLGVDPPYRRQDIGRRLLQAVGADLRASSVAVLEGIAVVSSAGEAFARHFGAVVGDQLADDVLQLASVDVDRLQRWLAPPEGYTLAHWVGSAPDALVDSYARAKRWITDAPNRHPPATPAWSAELVRARQRADARRGVALWVGVAVIADTASVVALTEIEAGPATTASQHDTVVLPGHRRHGLATAVKADVLLRLRAARADIDTIEVTGAVANVGMRSVNHRLGFREARRRTLYRLPLG